MNIITKKSYTVLCIIITTPSNFDIFHRKAAKKLYWVKKWKKKRVKWCKKMIGESKQFWRNVLFSDESQICINLRTPMHTYRRFPGTNPFQPQYMQRTSKRPVSVMVWGSFSYNGVGSLNVVEGYMNSVKYICILNENFFRQKLIKTK